MKRLLVAAFSTLLVAGCAHEGPATGSRVSGYVPAANAVVLMNEELEKPLAIEQHSGRRNATGALEVLVTLRNRTRGPLPVELRTSFLDRDRNGAEKPSAWQPVNLPPLSTEQYSEFSMTPDAVNYVVEVRFAQRR